MKIVAISVCLFFLFLPSALSQDFAGIEYLGELPHQAPAGFEKRLGLAQARWTQDDLFLLEGQDKRLQPWSIRLPVPGGLGWTKAWAADFDANGFRDILVIHFTPGNGRCPVHGDLLFVLYDAQQRPVVWKAESQLPDPDANLGGVLILDTNQDRKAEVVLHGCEYAMEDEVWSIHSMDGVFEAGEAQWTPLPAAAAATHNRLARKLAGIKSGDSPRWRNPPSAGWPAPFESFGQGDTQRLVSYRTPLYGCETFLPPTPTGKPRPGLVPAIVSAESSPCDSERDNRIWLQNGGELREIPDIVFDGESGREIHIGDSLSRAFWRLFRTESPVRVVGSVDNPQWLWAESPAASNRRLSGQWSDLRIRRSVPKEQTIRLRGYDGHTGYLYLDDRGCREIQVRLHPGEDTARFERPEDCPRLAAIRNNHGGSGRLLQVESELWLLHPDTATLRRLHNDGTAIDTIRFRHPSGARKRLISAAAMGDLWLAQWADARDTSMSVHNPEGEPITAPFAAPVPGELLRVTLQEGFLFARWSNGSPIETVRVQASIEITPAITQ